MSFVVAEDCVRLGLRAGAAVLRNVRVAAAGPGLRAEMAQEAQLIRERFASPAEVRSAPEVVHFQKILRRVGVNARREQPSVERLLHFALKRGDLPAVSNLVDAYNLISVRTFCSLGAHDLDRINLPVTLRLLSGRESFTPLGRDAPVAVVPGEFGYVDAQDCVLCRLDLLQADFSKVTPATVNALLIVEATAAHPPDILRQAIADAVDQIQRHCGGTAAVVAMP